MTQQAQWWKVIPEALQSEGLALSVLLATGTRDGVAVLDASGQLVFWNAAAVLITGWSIAEAATRRLGQVVENAGALTAIRDGSVGGDASQRHRGKRPDLHRCALHR